MQKKPVKIDGDPKGFRPEFSRNSCCDGCVFDCGGKYLCDGEYPCNGDSRPEGRNVYYVKE